MTLSQIRAIIAWCEQHAIPDTCARVRPPGIVVRVGRSHDLWRTAEFRLGLGGHFVCVAGVAVRVELDDADEAGA
jgi:hypothetical protein